MNRGIKLFSVIVAGALALGLASPRVASAKDEWKGRHDHWDHRDRHWDHDRGRWEHHDNGRHLGWYKHDHDGRYGRDWDHDGDRWRHHDDWRWRHDRWDHDGWRHGRWDGDRRYGRNYAACGGITDRIHNDRSKIAEIGPTGRHRKALQWYRDDLNNAHRDLANCRG